MGTAAGFPSWHPGLAKWIVLKIDYATVLFSYNSAFLSKRGFSQGANKWKYKSTWAGETSSSPLRSLRLQRAKGFKKNKKVLLVLLRHP